MRMIMTGGGTAGHINPALAIATYMKKRYPDTEVLFIGTESGLEKELVPKAGFDIKFIEAKGLKRKLTLENFKTLASLIKGSKEARDIIAEFKPDIIIGTGGYASFSTISEGCKQHIHTLIHESNILPGIANKILAKKVDKIAISFESTKNEFGGVDKSKIIYTGNPVKEEIVINARKRDISKVYGQKEYKVLVTGGSQGAQHINNAIREMIIMNKGKLPYKLVIATGAKNYAEFMQKLRDAGIEEKKLKNIEIKPYIFDMATELASANLVIGRCGAMTISEITAIGVPAILVPLPIADKNYQELNARGLEKQGAVKVIIDSELSGELINNTINELLKDKANLEEMARKSYELGERDALSNIENIIKSLVKSIDNFE